MRTPTTPRVPGTVPAAPGEEASVHPCAFCRGTGKDPFGIMSALSSCGACGGKGVFLLRGPHRACPHCRGTGAVKTFACGACRGSGLVPAAKPH